jgi:hypothetical protein
MRILLVLPALLLPLAAQTVVSPQHFTGTEGNGYSPDGFGTTLTPNRYLSIHGDLQNGPITITKISFRRDVDSLAMEPFSMLCDIFMSTAATTTSAPSATFDSNHGANKQQVAQFALYQFPATQPGSMPRPFQYPLLLSQPYSHAGTAPLCMELRITSRTNTSTLYCDWVSGASANPSPNTRSTGTGCRYTTAGPRLTLYGSGSASWSQGGVTFHLNGYNATPNSLLYASIGISDTTLGGIPLPFELPGTDVSPSGPCSVYNDVLIVMPTLANASGAVTVNLGLGVHPGYNGLSVFTQLIAPDANANNWGLVLSNGVQFHVVAPFTTVPIGEVYNNSGTGATGTVRADAGLVTQFN